MNPNRSSDVWTYEPVTSVVVRGFRVFPEDNPLVQICLAADEDRARQICEEHGIAQLYRESQQEPAT